MPRKLFVSLPFYFTILAKDAPSHIDFYRVELMLYKPFCNIALDIENSNEDFVANREHLCPSYTPLHVDRKPSKPILLANEHLVDDEIKPLHPQDLDEW